MSTGDGEPHSDTLGAVPDADAAFELAIIGIGIGIGAATPRRPARLPVATVAAAVAEADPVAAICRCPLHRHGRTDAEAGGVDDPYGCRCTSKKSSVRCHASVAVSAW